jgi:hypothetical protein
MNNASKEYLTVALPIITYTRRFWCGAILAKFACFYQHRKLKEFLSTNGRELSRIKTGF